jgi:hypothetical protein
MYKYNIPTDFAKENSSVTDKFNNSIIYKDSLFKKEYYPYQLNTWTENTYYGIIDNDGDVIVPNTLFLKNLPVYAPNNNTISAFDFVIEAFSEMKKYHSNFSLNNKLAKDYTNLFDLTVKSGYKDYETAFLETFNKQFNYFVSEFIKESDIKTFNDFIDIFLKFVDMVTLTQIPMTESGFMLSRFGDIKNSGLVLSFEDNGVNHNDLNLKYKKYINNSNFDTLVSTAARFGFILDKAAPWRLVMDINSPSAIAYMQNNGSVDINDFFKLKTVKLKYSDLNTLKVFLLGFYNSFTVKNKISKTALNDPNGCINRMYNFINLVNFREQKTIRLLEDKYDDAFFIRLYIYIKFRELKLELNQYEFDKIVLECQKINKYKDLETAMNYLDQYVRPKQKEIKQNLTTPDEVGKILQQIRPDTIRPTFKF